jgi:hypothetical protein
MYIPFSDVNGAATLKARERVVGLSEWNNYIDRLLLA